MDEYIKRLVGEAKSKALAMDAAAGLPDLKDQAERAFYGMMRVVDALDDAIERQRKEAAKGKGAI